MKSPFKLKNKKDFNFGNKEQDYGQIRDFHKKFDYSTDPDPSHEPRVRRSDLDEKGKAIWDAQRANKKKK
tara:strand:+ start:42 stop:251 length:210 start_codon:yes stop_codon:yes gene_type:complete